SLRTDAGRSTTSPAAILLATCSERRWIRPMGYKLTTKESEGHLKSRPEGRNRRDRASSPSSPRSEEPQRRPRVLVFFATGVTTAMLQRGWTMRKPMTAMTRDVGDDGDFPYFAPNAGAGYCGSFSRVRLARCISSSPKRSDGATIELARGSMRLYT